MAGESSLVLSTGGTDAALDVRLSAVEAQMPKCLSEDANHAVVFEGSNVRILSGSGATDGTVHGEGNRIIGYGENESNRPRTGSHSQVVASRHSYSSFGGLVAGVNNMISGPHTSVTGGAGNRASNDQFSVGGGDSSMAIADRLTVGGGTSQFNNTAGAFVS